MNCQEAQKLIDPFLKKELNLSQRVSLVRHIKSCERCREEMEFYFVVLITTDMIEEEKHIADYREAVERILEKTEQEYEEKQKKRRRIIWRFRFMMLFLCCCFCIGYRYPGNTVGNGLASGYLATATDALGTPVLVVHRADGNGLSMTYLQSRAYMRNDYIMGLWKRDYAVSRLLNPNGNISYEIPVRLLEMDAYEGKFWKRTHSAGYQKSTGYTIDIRYGYIQR